MPARKPSINLLPQDKRTTLFNQILSWALTFGRYTVVITELIVVICFLMRFSLDQRLSDLYDSIKQKQLFVRANSQFESDFRSVQQRLLRTHESLDKQLHASDIFTSLVSLTPKQITYSQFTLTQGKFVLAGSASSESEIKQLVSQSLTHPNLSSIALTGLTLSNDTPPRLNFQLEGNWHNK